MAHSKSREFRRAGVAVLMMAVGGCAYEVPTTVEMPGMPNPELAMRESMAHVEKEMGELGHSASLSNQGPVVVPAELDKVVEFEWSGSLDGAVK